MIMLDCADLRPKLARPQDSLRPSETSEADYAHFAPPRPQRSSAASDTFADYKHAADCGVSYVIKHCDS